MKPASITQQVLHMAYHAWNQYQPLRAQRSRLKNFTYGRQWGDITQLPDGSYVTEEQLAQITGRKPLTHNLIRQLIKSIIGRYRQIRSEQPAIDPALKPYYAINRLDELDCRALEEFLISGCAIQRIVAENRFGRPGVWVDNVSPERFFANRLTDPRGWDVEIIGQIHDMSLSEVQMRFSHGDSRTAAAIANIYSSQAHAHPATSQFFNAPDGRCRVIEVWTLESVATIDNANPADGELSMGTQWRVRYIAPDGQLLDTTLSPYPHGSHPYTIKLYPLTDGEVHPFVEDIIDQQKYINRLITVIDHVMATSAKGALLFPINQKPSDMTWEQIGKNWSATGAIIPYNPRPGEPSPQQIITPNTDLGAYRLLDLEMKLFDNISGVGDALLGRNVSPATGQNLYEAQVRNATIALLDILETFNSFVNERNEKMVRSNVILQ